MEHNSFTTISLLYRGPKSLWLSQFQAPPLPPSYPPLENMYANPPPPPLNGAIIFLQIPTVELWEASK